MCIKAPQCLPKLINAFCPKNVYQDPDNCMGDNDTMPVSEPSPCIELFRNMKLKNHVRDKFVYHTAMSMIMLFCTENFVL